MNATPADLLNQLTQKMQRIMAAVISRDEEKNGLAQKLASLEAEYVDPSTISVDDEAVMIRLATRATKISILPGQIKSVLSHRTQKVVELYDACSAVRRLIEKLLSTETQDVIEKIWPVFRPFCRTDEAAKFCANQTDIFASMNQLANVGPISHLPTQPYQQITDSTKDEAIQHADRVIAVASRFLQNGNSFIPRSLYPDFAP